MMKFWWKNAIFVKISLNFKKNILNSWQKFPVQFYFTTFLILKNFNELLKLK
jgi:hypothetical protein